MDPEVLHAIGRTVEEHDGYRKDLARPGIRRRDDLQKVHDYN